LGFLEKLIDAINNKLVGSFEKIKAATPHFVFEFIESVKHAPAKIKHKFTKVYLPKIQIWKLKTIGYSEHYLTLFRGYITQLFIYLRSEEFKKDKIKALIVNPFNYIVANPLKVLTVSSTSLLFIFAFYLIGSNTSKIITGTKSRAPASMTEAEVEDETVFSLNHFSLEVELPAESGGHHGEHLSVDIKFKTNSKEDVILIEDMHELVHDYLEALEVKAGSLPFPEEEKNKLQEKIKLELNEGLYLFAHKKPIQSVTLIFHLHGRPTYYRLSERTYQFQNVDFQLFEEDLKRNHQVYIDFTVISSNRNIILFLKDNEMMVRDRLSTNVEPILPRLPVEEEGKRIIKDKIRDEINELLKEKNIEGKILEVYLDFSLAS
jgi:hypothetical protein